MTNLRVAVALSGGVDSSVVAAMLKTQGYDVYGITCKLLPEQEAVTPYAQAVARILDIPHEVIDLTALYTHDVISPFCRAYQSGRTPNPCIDCNRHIKFGAMLDYTRATGARYLATGHYARIAGDGEFKLLQASDRTKDQSYFLYTLTQSQLKDILFPLGTLPKTEVRQLAANLGVAEHTKQEESQDLCFVADNDYAAFVAKYQPAIPGDIVDGQGQVLGQHSGLSSYTIGQRHGLGVASTAPLYVTSLNATQNQVVVGPKEALYRSELVASELNWIAGHPPSDLSNVTARVRYKSPASAVTITSSLGMLRVSFQEPQWAIAPGQSIVFYRGEEVLGGGVIS